MTNIYKIEIRTRFGPDIILVKGEVTDAKIMAIYKKLRKDIVEEDGEDSEYPYIEVTGAFPEDEIPTIEEYIETIKKKSNTDHDQIK